MKQTIFHFIIYACITGSLSSCENEIPYNPEQKAPLLIMNACSTLVKQKILSI